MSRFGAAALAELRTEARLVSALRGRLAGWRRDLRMLVDGLAGRHPAPLEFRESSGTAPPVRALAQEGSLSPRTLRVAEVVRETADAVTLWLVDPSPRPGGVPLVFEAGQFLTLLLPVGDGQLLRRAYSASSSPLGGCRIAVTCKRVPGGKGSSYLHDHVVAGALLQVLGPSGSFTPRPHPDRRRHLVLIGGGSGITPLVSILETVLAVEPSSRVSLIYGNRGEADIIFYKRLRALAGAHAGRLTVRHVLREPPSGWRGGVGILDEEVLSRELSALPAAAELPAEYWLCGPEPMMAAARALLLREGAAPDSIHEERFASLHYTDDAPSAMPQVLTLRLPEARTQSVVVRPGETLLEAGLREGVAMPFSCAVGGCGACKGRLVAGQVMMPEPNCLTAAERQAGAVLCCVARPRTAVTVEVLG